MEKRTTRTITSEAKRQRDQAWYAALLRTPAYAFWAGKIDYAQFIHDFTNRVWDGLIIAWQTGAARAGIAPDEMTDAELNAVNTRAFDQLQYIPGFADFIQSHSRSTGGKLRTVIHRLGLWVSRWREFETLGYMMAKADQKMQWRLGPTDKHCGSCVKLNGKVKRASQWLAAGIYPKCPDLECKGYNCLCTLVPTKEPLSKGRLPKLP